MLIHWIWLAHLPELKDRDKCEFLRHFASAEDLYFADEKALDTVDGLSRKAKEVLLNKDLTRAEEILSVCGRERLHILTIRDAAYPSALKNITDPPVVLYYKGQLPDFDSNPVIGVVGTRKASPYGLTTAKSMGGQIAACGGIVVSGLAKGIDGMAMGGALSAGGTVAGVLGCGADVVYPACNRSLFMDTEKYGCILSEFAPGTPPLKQNFPRRNRIISGLSNGVLVVEAPAISGALITARQAGEQGRDVFVIPGNIDQSGFAGSNALMRDGAIMVTSGWEILSEYEGLYPDKIRRAPVRSGGAPARERKTPETAEPRKTAPKRTEKPVLPEKKKDLNKEFNKKVIDKAPSAPYSDVKVGLPKLSEDEQAIVTALSSGERLVDDVIAETGMSTGKLLAALTMLELKGVLKRLPGKKIVLREK